MITTFTSTETCLYQSSQKVIADNQRVFLVSKELCNKSRPAQSGTTHAGYEEIKIVFPSHVLGLPVKVDNNVSSFIEYRVTELPYWSGQDF